MKRLLTTILAIAGVCVLSAQTPRHIEWSFTKKRAENYLESGIHRAVRGRGTIEFIGKKSYPTEGFKRHYPAVEGCRQGDYWLMTIPVENIEAGTAIDLWFPFLAEPSDTPHAFAFEYFDGTRWQPVLPANKKGVNCYSTTSEKWPRFLWQTIRLSSGVKKGDLQVRLRLCDKSVTKCSLHGRATDDAPKIAILDERIPSDTTRVLFIGNSYTFFNLYPMQLKEIAWNEGHYLDCSIYIHGGYSMRQHLNNHISCETVEQGGYNYAFLQDQSLNSLRIGTVADQDVVEYMGKMAVKVKEYSPKAKLFIELTWGRKNGNDATKSKKLRNLVEAHPEYFTDYATNQRVITEKTTAMAQELGLELSPVGVAWEIVRRERPDIELYYKDCYHPSDAGSYLSAAVAYLTIFKEPFKADTPVRLDPEVARYLRSVAERVVLK